MRYCLLLTHGNFATGIHQSIKLLMGEQENFHAISAYVDGETNIAKEIDNFYKNLKKEDELILFTDILGGSINNAAMNFLDKKNVHLITGINLPLLCEVLNNLDDKRDLVEILHEAIEESKNSIYYCNEMIDKTEEDDF